MISQHSDRSVVMPRNTVELDLIRRWRGEATIGELYWEGVWQCYILEPQKPIPAGRYEIRLTHSPKFGRTMPILCEVPGHSGIRIHTGNTAKDTKCCLLPGSSRGPDRVDGSAIAYEALNGKLELSAGPRFITIKEAIE